MIETQQAISNLTVRIANYDSALATLLDQITRTTDAREILRIGRELASVRHSIDRCKMDLANWQDLQRDEERSTLEFFGGGSNP